MERQYLINEHFLPLRYVLNYNPHAGRSRRNWWTDIVMMGGSGSGKSEAVAYEIIRAVHAEKGVNVLCIRQFRSTMKGSVWALFMKIIDRLGWEDEFSINITDLTIISKRTRNIIAIRGLDKASKLLSITPTTGTFTHVWIEEATETGEDSVKIIGSRLRGVEVERMLSGNMIPKMMVYTFNPISSQHWIPQRFGLHFENGKLVSTNSNAWCHHSTILNNAFVDPRDIDYLRSFEHTDPNFFQIFFRGLFGTSENADSIYPQHLIRAALENVVKPEGGICIGIDPASYPIASGRPVQGGDMSVMYLVHGYKQMMKKESRGADGRTLADMAEQMISAYREKMGPSGKDTPVTICVDATGIGVDCLSSLKVAGIRKTNTFGIHGGEAARNQQFKDLRTEIHFHLRSILPQVSIQNDPALIHEMGDRRFGYTADGRQIVEPKKDYKSRNGGVSPDHLDALALAFYGLCYRPAQFHVF